jgi:sucrose-6-phosphate hydrolase SacC (GH32 family)
VISEQLERDGVDGSVADIILTVTPGEASDVGLRLHRGDDQVTLVGYRPQDQTLYVDRTASGDVDFHPDFAGVFEAPLELGEDDAVEIRVVVDRSSVEVFADRGEVVITSLLFPSPGSAAPEIYAEGSPDTIGLDVWELAA